MKFNLNQLRELAHRNAIRAGVAGVVLVPGLSHAAAPDVTEVVTGIEAAATPIAAIGAAVLLVMVGIKVFKWVRQAM